MARQVAPGVQQVDEYLAAAPEPHRTTLEAVRARLRAILPRATEGLAYGMPVFKVDGKSVASYAPFKQHCSYFPHSGRVLAELTAELKAYARTKGALHFPVDKPLSVSLLRKLVKARIAELERRRAR